MELTAIVIVGHVDHGKSTLIGRLLFDTENLSPDRLADIRKASEEHGRRMEFAYVTDQFEEEREKNVTIDTSQTFLKIDGRPFVIVDAPGHKEYLKNMITGATQAQHGIIMLDVNEGIREQTEKHARILKLLGISHVAIFVNKMDMVEFSGEVFERRRADLESLMGEVGIAPSAIIPISAYNGDNVATHSPKMDWYAGPTALEFMETCASLDRESGSAPLRLPVQLVREHGGASVLLGRVEQGTIRKGQKVTIFPGGESATVAAILKYREDVSESGEGECVAVRLEGGAAPKRGDVLVEGKAAAPVQTVSVHAFWASAEPLRPGEEVIVECRTQSAPFEVVSVADEVDSAGAPLAELAGGEVGQVLLRSRGPMLAESEPEGTPMSRLVFHRNGQVAGCGVVAHVA